MFIKTSYNTRKHTFQMQRVSNSQLRNRHNQNANRAKFVYAVKTLYIFSKNRYLCIHFLSKNIIITK